MQQTCLGRRVTTAPLPTFAHQRPANKCYQWWADSSATSSRCAWRAQRTGVVGRHGLAVGVAEPPAQRRHRGEEGRACAPGRDSRRMAGAWETVGGEAGGREHLFAAIPRTPRKQERKTTGSCAHARRSQVTAPSAMVKVSRRSKTTCACGPREGVKLDEHGQSIASTRARRGPGRRHGTASPAAL